MQTTQRTLPLGPSKPALTLTARIIAAVSGVASLLRVLRNRREINSLSELDDSQLRDIGLTRFDVRSALLTSSFFEDPSAHLTHSARRRARGPVSAFPRD